jgi:hypothetical protein
MGRTFKSIRMGSQEVSNRWLKASRALSKEDQIYGQRLAEMVKMHSSEAFYTLRFHGLINFYVTWSYSR